MPYGMGPAGWGYHPYGLAVVGVGIPGGLADRFHHGGLQPKKRRLGFLKKGRIIFEMSWATLRRGSKNLRNSYPIMSF